MAGERNEKVVKHGEYYKTDLGDNLSLYSVLFEKECPLQLCHDLIQQLYLALDQTADFDDCGLVEYDAEYGGNVRFAPGVAWAHAHRAERRHVAVLPLPLSGVPRGKVPVTVGRVTDEIFFVTDEFQHLAFFRSVMELENADEAMFERLATSAFPALEWADDVWSGLGDFSRPYIAVRSELVRCLAGLNDHGAACFHECLTVNLQDLPGMLSARIGSKTSDENGRTKRHRPSKRDRTRRYRGEDKVFWWHVKLQPHVDRIHFRHDYRSGDSSWPQQGRIVVGLFKDHCVLPQ